MILVNDNWEQIYDLQDVSKIIRENYNEDLADELDELIPEHTASEYENLQWDYYEKCDKLTDLENEIDDLKEEIERTEKRVARELLSIIEKFCFSQESIEYRVNQGSNGTRDLIIKTIKEKYDIV